MVYRNKVFVSFDGDNDIHYYRLMCAWKQNDNTPFDFCDAHDITQARDTSLEDSIKRSLWVRLSNSKTFVVLIGEQTRYLRRFVLWEMEQALHLDLPIIGVNLNGLRARDDARCPPVIREALAIYASFNVKILQHALEHWPEAHASLRAEGKTGPYYYSESVYRQFGL